jgi:RNA polymerase sigma-70 factor (ECF subfamily)
MRRVEVLGDLVERARNRDPDAWEALYRRMYSRLHAYARRRLPSSEDPDDAVSETMMRAVDRIGVFTWEGAGFDAWLYGICRNVVLESVRASGRATPQADPPDAAIDDPPEARLLAQEESASLRAAFARLRPEDRELLELRVVGGLSSEEVAAVLGKRPGAVRTAQSRALARLRSLLGET